MTAPRRPPAPPFGSIALAVAFGAALAAACGGKSIRTIDDDGAAGEPDPGPGGGASSGGRGGTSFGGTSFGGTGASGGTSPMGGSGAFGGTLSGGASFGGTGASGGTIATGGTFAGTGAGPAGGATGMGGCGPRPGPSDPSRRVNWDEFGIIGAPPNFFGFRGSWYSFDDCQSALPANLPCTKRADILVGPDGNAGWTVTPGYACAMGVAPRVELGPDGVPAYALQWGFGFGFTLNGGESYNALGSCIRGFVIDIAANGPPTLRINLVTAATRNEPHFVEVVANPNTVIDFASVRQGPWVTNPVPFDPAAIADVQFHVYTNTAFEQPFEFCVSNVRALD